MRLARLSLVAAIGEDSLMMTVEIYYTIFYCFLLYESSELLASMESVAFKVTGDPGYNPNLR